MFYGNNELPSFDNLIDMKTIFACLIFIINVAVYAQSRDPRSKDQANVFWNGTYPLYSLTSDILISPNNLGEYIFWGTTNEDPSPKEYKLLKGQMNTIYKFIDYQECVNFCNEVRKSKGMQLLQVKTEVYTVQIENCESARNDYLNKNPDVKKAGIDPWTHYNYYGKNEGRVWPNCKDGNIEGEEITKTEFNSLKWESKGKTTFEKTSQTEWMEKSNASSFYYDQVSSDSKGVLLKDKNRSGVYIFLDNSNCQYKDANTEWITLYYGNWVENSVSSLETTNEYLPQNFTELTASLDSIQDVLQKIDFLNKIITNLENKARNEKQDLSSEQLALWALSYTNKLQLIIPNQFDNQSITQLEWESLFNYLTTFISLHESIWLQSKTYRAFYLYWLICVRQKLNKQDMELHKMVVTEFTRDNFDVGSNFYDQCKAIVESNSKSSKPLPPRTCSYKFSKPTLTVTWIDNRKKCCNPYCNEWSSYSNVKEDNLKNAELQYLNDALDAHFLEVNADNNHRALDYIALSEFKTKNYYNDQILGDFSKLFAAFDVMSGALSSTMLSSMSVLTNETVQEKIIRLKSKKKSLSLYRTTKYCSKSCEQLVDDMGYKCD